MLGDERSIEASLDWQNAHPDALWMFNLHYFDDLNAAETPGRVLWQRAFIERWLRENPPGVGVGWAPYPTSVRVVNWIRWLLRGEEPVPGMLHSLAIQTRYLRDRLEHHLLGNHLFVNIKALLFAGTFFDGPEADRWRSEGHRLLARELEEQILDDGGHFERSPMYHALILEDVLDLLALERAFPGTGPLTATLRAAAARMQDWLTAMTHPDGEIALFNDATTGVAATPAALAGYAGTLDIPKAPTPTVVDLPASGYTRIERGGAVLLTDAGELGPDYLPAHGHADTLSFELSIQGRRVIVDSGVSEYGRSAERVRQRGTRAHNTVVVDDEDSSEVWSGFRVARRARVIERRVDVTAARVTIRAAHDGYHRLRGRVTHSRLWDIENGALAIHDEVRGHGRHRVEIVLHFAPDLRPVPLRDGLWSLGERIQVETDPGLVWTVRAGTVHPSMGARIPAWILEGRVDATLPVQARTAIMWM